MTTVSTSYLARAYSTTTPEVERRLLNAGVKPVRIEVQQSTGKTFKTWDRDKACIALDQWKMKRKAELERREKLKHEMASEAYKDIVSTSSLPPAQAQAVVEQKLANTEAALEVMQKAEQRAEDPRLLESIRDIKDQLRMQHETLLLLIELMKRSK